MQFTNPRLLIFRIILSVMHTEIDILDPMRREPVILGTARLLPSQPLLPRFIGQEIFLGETVRAGESQRAFADEEHMVTTFHDLLRDTGGILDIAQRRDTG